MRLICGMFLNYAKGALSGGGPGFGVDNYLMETGDNLLMETGDVYLLES